MRNIDPNMLAALESGLIRPALLVMLTFNSGVKYIWSGVGNLVWNAQTFVGVGSLGQVGQVIEASEVQADGTTVSLSGIDPTLMSECLTDIQLGAPATVWFALLTDTGQIIGTPLTLFSGLVDQPVFQTGGEEMKITLHLETRMSNLNRASQRRYTAEDQNAQYPTDTSFVWVPVLQDIALNWQPR